MILTVSIRRGVDTDIRRDFMETNEAILALENTKENVGAFDGRQEEKK